AVLTARAAEVPPGPAVVRVADTLAAFGALARAWRDRLGIKVVAVTGSSGKTSTKEAIADLLGRFAPTARSFANYNNEVGVPLTLLGLRPGPEVAVLELAMRGPGEIRYLTEIARPDVGVITNIGTAHIGRLGSQDAIAQAKGELLAAMGPQGVAVLNGDDPRCRALGAGRETARFFSAAGPAGAHVFARTPLEPDGDHWAFTAAWDGGTSRVRLSIPGTHHVQNALAALTVALALGYAPPPALTLAPPPVGGRSRLVAVGDVEVLDESYNANPESVRATLESFCALPCQGRRVVVLGDMAELGDFAEEAHRAIGRHLDDLPVDLVVAVGDLAALIAETTAREALRCRSNAEAVEALGRALRAGDRLLVKGSRAGRLEEIIAGLSEVYA
ncbi:MAG: UDP-N-acetylmuramoyl-tripeptide--D-alanyl-D-alanine ligase, partial [Candidatus Sericytochromatia bacterium]|nr:UDP-N-acetylmuramoyl-tripeptide--D-alanyl-D-alanine ligase [Candidatus Tanganyikabacteria bacterium]